MGQILDGKKVAQDVKSSVANWIQRELSRVPKLIILTAGDDDASKVYVRNKLKAAESVGIEAEQVLISEDLYGKEYFWDWLDNIIDSADGVILQLPAPKWCDVEEITRHIPAHKDVDGFTDINVGELRTKEAPTHAPCTPAGIMELLIEYDLIKGSNALVIGRSNLVGRPIAEMLLQADYTVTIAHSKTPKDTLLKLFAEADVVVSAAGVRDLITETDGYDLHKPGRIIIDVSINRDENGKLCGDMSEDFKDKYSDYYTPVPGGIGPMTVAMLMFNTYMAARYNGAEKDPE